ncbi:hypothetical protein COLU111180_18370 [Cohnella lubricantis]|uniref:DUF948 domain-containing protein n=1 Tax=Cohnella lubricantis TaxID=2163172 RepID=A0A841TK41_9BACL|nr:hypothetical protein [Cohnella lubricantis]MBB6679307.1 hypothetical protein [Cohnella lubricantis]MBP2120384.1 hypothetical protein [Cohnella lubricantis]
MAWEVTAYVLSALGLIAIVAIAAAAVAVRRLLNKWSHSLERLEQEAEATLQQWRRLGKEASETAEQCRRSLSGFESLAEGGRAIGEAAQTAAYAAASTVVEWTERLSDRLSETADRQTRRLGEAMDWMEVGFSLWETLRRAASTTHPASRQPEEPAEENR